jgi:hypothetical protein
MFGNIWLHITEILLWDLSFVGVTNVGLLMLEETTTY